MPILYLNTTKLDFNLYELYHQKQVGYDVTGWSDEKKCKSKIEAVLFNVGLACKYLIENYPDDKLIEKTIALLDDREESSEREQYEIYKICQGLKYGKIDGNLYQFELRFGKKLEQWLNKIVYYIRLGNIKIALYYMKNNEFCLEERQIKSYTKISKSLKSKLQGIIK